VDDVSAADLTHVPLSPTSRPFQDDSGTEVSAESICWLKCKLILAGLSEFAHGGHAIRIGAATVVSAAEGEDATLAVVGRKCTRTKRQYIHVDAGECVYD
jgi:hypothetical protein